MSGAATLSANAANFGKSGMSGGQGAMPWSRALWKAALVAFFANTYRQ